jgi:3-oxoacyl-[acyl-carrier protein] reductase
MTLDSKIALVTGGSRGIGRAIVERLARDGAQVYFTCRTEPRTPGAIGIRTDHQDAGSVEAMFAVVGDRLDVLVNNAAINPGAPLADLTAEEFDRVLTVNTKVPLLAMRAAAARLAGPDAGWITGQNIRATGGLLV